MTGNWKFPADAWHTHLPSPSSVCPPVPSHSSNGSSSPKPGKEKRMGDKGLPSRTAPCPPWAPKLISLAAPSRGWGHPRLSSASSIIHSLLSAPQTKGSGESAGLRSPGTQGRGRERWEGGRGGKRGQLGPGRGAGKRPVRKGSRMNLIWNSHSRSHAAFTHEMHYSDRTKKRGFFSTSILPQK